MTSIEEHKKAIASLLKDIEDKVKADTIVEMQKLIGFSCSEAACNLFALLLHRKNLITAGFNVNHRFFASGKTAGKKFAFEFPKKAELLNLLVKQENFRELICYGREKERPLIEDCIKNAHTIKKIVEEVLG